MTAQKTCGMPDMGPVVRGSVNQGRERCSSIPDPGTNPWIKDQGTETRMVKSAGALVLAWLHSSKTRASPERERERKVSGKERQRALSHTTG